ncbi:hypothetical protein CGZ80_22430 [Rhodopirellula sp. MGV]|nr:hypothetical protein CGZ80_22430 [Rhodopirellula sp. MGV]PNY35060.1 hypothetical protein C2E31_20340 [Rhodopirellula baltica]PNY36801.1 hypothetical protein C2E31_11150 [Rhodopirellula baltica]
MTGSTVGCGFFRFCARAKVFMGLEQRRHPWQQVLGSFADSGSQLSSVSGPGDEPLSPFAPRK